MTSNDKKRFAELMTGVAEMFGKPMGKPQLQMYFASLEDLTIEQVSQGLTKHVKCPDSGQFMPKPADIIKHVTGTKKESDADLEVIGQSQWVTAQRAISECGSYRTPKFRDPITAACVIAGGGWTHICSLTKEQLVWAGKEFVNNYQSYSTRPLEQLPSHIAGREDIQALRSESSTSLKTIVTNLDNLKINKNGANNAESDT